MPTGEHLLEGQLVLLGKDFRSDPILKEAIEFYNLTWQKNGFGLKETFLSKKIQ